MTPDSLLDLLDSTATAIASSLRGLEDWGLAGTRAGQYRSDLAADALDLCAVACGIVDGYLACSRDAHGVWDYAGGLLICQEAGAAVADALGRELIVLEHDARRTPVAAATPALFDELLAIRGTF